MGVVVLQLGQGGNQFGYAFFDALATLTSTAAVVSSSSDFFKEPLRPTDPAPARALLIDTEPKVVTSVRRLASTRGRWMYQPKNSFTQDSGSGNNWARGYCKHGPECQEGVLDIVRREVEACDIFGGFVTMQSIAGGTGSGLGVYLVEVLRDEYPSSCILSHCIWPFEGEVAVQCYNTLLSLAHLQNLADGLILVRNEALMTTCRKVLNVQRPSFQQMNEVGAHAFASMLLPSYLRQANEQSSKTSEAYRMGPRIRVLSDLAPILCAHPKYRMLALHALPQVPKNHTDFAALSWKSHLKELKRMFYMDIPKEKEAAMCEFRNNPMEKRREGTRRRVDRCVSNLLVLRGKDSLKVDTSLFNDTAIYPIWSVDPLTVAAHPSNLGRYDMFAGMLSNCYSAIAPASLALSRAYSMYSANAYLFQYFDHGLNKDVFDASFATVEDVLSDYLAL